MKGLIKFWLLGSVVGVAFVLIREDFFQSDVQSSPVEVVSDNLYSSGVVSLKVDVADGVRVIVGHYGAGEKVEINLPAVEICPGDAFKACLKSGGLFLSSEGRYAVTGALGEMDSVLLRWVVVALEGVVGYSTNDHTQVHLKANCLREMEVLGDDDKLGTACAAVSN